MNSRLRFLLVFCGAVCAITSCSVFEPGAPSAAVTVRARSTFQVSDILERVFVDEGYQPTQRSQDGITFDRAGGKVDSVLYGNWIGGDVAQRVRVTITSRGNDKYRLRALPSVVREPNDVAFEDARRRWELHSTRYSRMLREVRKKCEQLWRSREGTEES